MPRLSEAKKDVISCDKLWVGANSHRYRDFAMEHPVRLQGLHPVKGGERVELKHLSSRRRRK